MYSLAIYSLFCNVMAVLYIERMPAYDPTSNAQTLLQDSTQPLFPDILWSQPETKAFAGKLLIIGGNLHSVALPNIAYTTALTSGAGEVKVVMPDATKRYFDLRSPNHQILFADSTPSGSFSQEALPAMLAYAAWADCICIVGDSTKNSETAQMYAALLPQIDQSVVICGDSFDTLLPYSTHASRLLKGILVVTFSQLQKFAIALGYDIPLTSTLVAMQFTNWLQQFTSECQLTIVTHSKEVLYVAHDKTVITTRPIKQPNDQEFTKIAVRSGIWAMQQPEKTTEAIATSFVAYN